MAGMSTPYSVIGSPKKPVPQDWHKADIVAAVHKRGTSLQRVSRQHRYHPNALHMALHRPWPKAERIIADIIGVSPQEIWPSRYNRDGTPRSGRGERITHRGEGKHNTGGSMVNVRARSVA